MIVDSNTGMGVHEGIVISVVTSAILLLRLLLVKECEDEGVCRHQDMTANWAKHEYGLVTVTKV